jgi:transcriptional regulator with PAS, ATPase and Fis domain
LLHLYLSKFNEQYQQNKSFSAETLDILQTYDWPGNIRELEHLVERLVITSSNDILYIYDLPSVYKKEVTELELYQLRAHETLPAMLERIEKEMIEAAYVQHSSTRKTANALGMTQSALMRRIKKFGI